MKNKIQEETQSLASVEYKKIADRFHALSEEYGDMDAAQMARAFARATGGDFALKNPYIQNRRVKAISSLPVDHTKDEVARMLQSPDGNELGLRQVGHGLEFTAYPLLHLRRVYQDLLTYHSYISPEYAEEEDAKKDDFWREWRLVEKFRKAIDPKRTAHKLVGQVLQEGKVFYAPRYKVDKVHNKVPYAFLQQLPSDWTKIVGFNNVSGYTVAVNLFYFLQPGTDPLQFGDLFVPYLDAFREVTAGGRKQSPSAIYSSAGVDWQRFRAMQDSGRFAGGIPEVYTQNGRWFYWVTLPADRVYTFEADDASSTVVSPFTGLYLSMIQLATYEQVQLELVQNPLISLITGEIPYRDQNTASESDPYKLSNAGRMLFQALFYEMLESQNTSGIGLYMAPLEHMQLHQLAEAPSATKISGAGYEYAMNKAGTSAMIPSSSDTRAGVAQISLQIESRFGQSVYRSFERMMNGLLESMNLKYQWEFHMFGDLATDKQTEESARQGMTLGILPDTMIYLALQDMSLLDDISISNAILGSGILDKRIPLVSTYSAKQGESGLPPQAKHDLSPGGRPSGDGTATSDGQEGDIDSGL